MCALRRSTPATPSILTKRLVRTILSLLTLGLLACPWSIATAQSLAAQIEQARAFASQCRLAEAVGSSEAALAKARLNWPPGSPELAVILVDLAAFKNRLGDSAGAEVNAREAEAVSQTADPKFGALHALAELRLGDALLGLNRIGEAQAHLVNAHQYFRSATHEYAAMTAVALSKYELRRGVPTQAVRYAEEASALAAKVERSSADIAAQAKLQLAESYRRAMQFDQAGDVLDGLLRANPKGQDARLILANANLAFDRGKFADALSLVEKAESWASASASVCDRTLRADLQQRRGTIHLLRREIGEARLAYDAALNSLQQASIVNDPRQGEIFFGMADAAYLAGEFQLSSALFDRAAESFRRAYGRPSIAEAGTLIEKGFMLTEADMPRQAIQDVGAGQALLEQSPDKSAYVSAIADVVTGQAYKRLGMLDQAQASFTMAIAKLEHQRGMNSFELPPSLIALGEMEIGRGRPSNALPILQRALAIQQSGGASSPLTAGLTLSRIAAAHAALGNRKDARSTSASAVETLERRLLFGEAQPWMDADAERRRSREILDQNLRLLFADVRPSEFLADAESMNRSFKTGQLAASLRTGAAIAQMSRRLQSKNDHLGRLLRERDDLVQEWRLLEEQKNRMLATTEAGPVDRDGLGQRQAAILVRLAGLDAIMRREFPQSDLIVSSTLVDVRAVQRVLRPVEAVVTFTVMDDRTFVFVVGAKQAFGYAVAISRRELQAQVDTLRASVIPKMDDLHPPTFDAVVAFGLYEKLLHPAIAALGETSTLLVVPDGPIASIPLGILITRPAASAPRRASELSVLSWLARQYAINQFPSAASIVTLRQLSRPASREGSFVGFGAPVLSGSADANIRAIITRSMGKTILANPSVLAMLPSLPESEVELVEMGRVLGTTNTRLMVGPAATEKQLKALPLKDFRVVAFATHGLVSGDLKGYAEAALVLTPPRSASAEDDGLLSASEVAGLDLDADWVILSACNTAAGSDGGAEPLSGLAKAFFYAGARSLLVSHWPVSSTAAVSLTTATVKAVAVGKSPPEALREAQIAMIDDADGTRRTHPYFWAPFSLVGSTGQ